MTKLLQQAIAEIEKLSQDEQDRIAAQILSSVGEASGHSILQLSDDQLVELRHRIEDREPRLLNAEEFQLRMRRRGA